MWNVFLLHILLFLTKFLTEKSSLCFVELKLFFAENEGLVDVDKQKHENGYDDELHHRVNNEIKQNEM